jgi:hypothetical protein
VGKSKTFSRKKKIAPVDNPPERLQKSIVDLRLANLGAHETAVALNANFAASEKVRHSRNGLFRVPRAGADGNDQVTERKFRFGLEDEVVFLHGYVF